MKAFSYLIAGAALLPELAAGLNATANDAIWKYQGCYSDKSYQDVSANGVAARGVPYFPRTLNGLFVRNATNSGKACRDYCLSNLFPVAATNNDQCWCDTTISKNGTSATAPTYGIRDPDDSNCQQPCPGNLSEACGNSTANAPVQRLTVYQMSAEEKEEEYGNAGKGNLWPGYGESGDQGGKEKFGEELFANGNVWSGLG
ncbi:hypothetical protein J1614_001188 [Plenodomus biglobosus]|nr:hypothetical protein J1614_001188 [Plenodomus biglobosus]